MNYDINKDCLFLIGDSHTVCQDYTLAGSASEGVEYLIVCDGCSSSKDSDLGARILALMAKQYLHYLYGPVDSQRKYFNFGNVVITKARDMAQQLGINQNCLDATLLVTVYDNGSITTYVYGDGNIITATKDGQLDVTNISFESGAPFYLNYWNNQGRMLGYQDQFPGQLVIKRPSYEARENYAYPMYRTVHVEDISMIAISTDGMESFADKGDNNMIAIDNLIGGLFVFKNTNGEFLKRRVGRHVESLNKSGIVHHDDLGMAAMIFKEYPDVSI